MSLRRREFVVLATVLPRLLSAQSDPQDWTCPMDRDVHSDKPGKCPRCGMTLVRKVPDDVEYTFSVDVEPPVLHPGHEALLKLVAIDPNGKRVDEYQIVHEKLMHLFVVSEDLEFFAHIHPDFDGHAFFIRTRLPRPGMYRLLADYYPTVSVPQLSLATMFVDGPRTAPHLKPSIAPQRATNVTASLRSEPEEPIAGLTSRLFFDLDPYDGLEPYLGAWAHTLIASEDLIDLIHTHPVLLQPPAIQFNVTFPRPGLYRIWTQFERLGAANTVVFTVPVKAI